MFLDVFLLTFFLIEIHFVTVNQRDSCFQLNDIVNQNLRLEIVAVRTIATLAIQVQSLLPAITKKLAAKIIPLFKADIFKIMQLLIIRTMLRFNLQMDQYLMAIWNMSPHLSKNVIIIAKILTKTNLQIVQKRIALKDLGIDRNSFLYLY